MAEQPEEKGFFSGGESVKLVSPDGRTIEVKDGDVVGRTAVGKEMLDIHEEISRRHARFVISEGTWHVIDLNSSNGTFLDGERLPPGERVPIRNGQELKISPVFGVVVTIGEAVAGKEDLPSPYAGSGGAQHQRRTMVVLFADLKGSVDFFQEKGTIVARNWIVNLYRMLSSVISAHRGAHLKNIGDAILAVFEDPHEAARAALDMQADLMAHNLTADETGPGRYYIRIGMNMGTVLFEDNDVFGNCVNIASRVQAIAPPEHIFITGRLYEEIRDDKDIEFRFIGHQQLKGVKEKTEIYEIVCGRKNDPEIANSL